MRRTAAVGSPPRRAIRLSIVTDQRSFDRCRERQDCWRPRDPQRARRPFRSDPIHPPIVHGNAYDDAVLSGFAQQSRTFRTILGGAPTPCLSGAIGNRRRDPASATPMLRTCPCAGRTSRSSPPGDAVVAVRRTQRPTRLATGSMPGAGRQLRGHIGRLQAGVVPAPGDPVVVLVVVHGTRQSIASLGGDPDPERASKRAGYVDRDQLDNGAVGTELGAVFRRDAECLGDDEHWQRALIGSRADELRDHVEQRGYQFARSMPSSLS